MEQELHFLEHVFMLLSRCQVSQPKLKEPLRNLKPGGLSCAWSGEYRVITKCHWNLIGTETDESVCL